MNELPVILVTDRGSSSIKLLVLDAANREVLVTGIADNTNSENAFIAINGGEPAKLVRHSYEDALKAIAAELEKRSLMNSVALIGHRIVHGGDIFTESAIITDGVINNIRRVSPLVPLYDYTNPSGTESAQHPFPGVQQVTVFDTSFHQTIVPEAYLYDLPWKYYEELGACRYGFHDTSHRYVSQRARELPDLQNDDSGLAVAHLGSGTSICAVRNGQSVDTFMDMTPLEGLMMDTRSGDVDFGAMVWVTSETNQTLDGLGRIANKESGLLGISGLSSNPRTLEKAWHEGYERARLAVETFVHHVVHHIAGHATSLHCLNRIVFTDGIGEDSVLTRRLVIEYLAVLGVNVDGEMNSLPSSRGERITSNKDARVICVVIPTNEKKMTVRDVIALGKINTLVEFT